MKSQWLLGGFCFTNPRDPDFCTWEYIPTTKHQLPPFCSWIKIEYEENPRKIHDFQGKGSRIPKPQLLGDLGRALPYFSPPSWDDLSWGHPKFAAWWSGEFLPEVPMVNVIRHILFASIKFSSVFLLETLKRKWCERKRYEIRNLLSLTWTHSEMSPVIHTTHLSQ